ncbi:MAG: hypothetical protein ACRCSG_06780 [Cellulosilyticaceae bacterium]
MYCIVGEKILRCEVSEKLENYSWIRVGRSEKGQTVPNNRIFETEESALAFLKKRSKTRVSIDQELSSEINSCKRMYSDFLKETGISVRLIDRLFKVQDVEKQLAHLRKKYNKSDTTTSGESKTPTDSRFYSKKSSSQFKTQKVYKDSPNHSFKSANKKRNTKNTTKP